MKLKNNNRSRMRYAIAIVIVILMGLGSRRFSNYIPQWMGDYAGDMLWALMIFLGIGFLFNSWPTLRVGKGALLFCFAIELSQLYHSPWIDSIRRTRLGSLVLGFGFLWTDLICYSIGIMIGILIELLIKANYINNINARITLKLRR